MKVVIIKYNAGNVQSVLFALKRSGINGILTDNPEEIISADKVIFPGVGEAGSAMKHLKEKKLDKTIISLKQPVLGICLGMQLLCKHSEEGNTECLGIIDSAVKRFPLIKGDKRGLKVPQIGWNNIFNIKEKLLEGIPENSFMYFVHSYYVEQNVNSTATTKYILDYCSALQKDNFYAVQFHPEKSSVIGQKILENFLAHSWRVASHP